VRGSTCRIYCLAALRTSEDSYGAVISCCRSVALSFSLSTFMIHPTVCISVIAALNALCITFCTNCRLWSYSLWWESTVIRDYLSSGFTCSNQRPASRKSSQFAVCKNLVQRALHAVRCGQTIVHRNNTALELVS